MVKTLRRVSKPTAGFHICACPRQRIVPSSALMCATEAFAMTERAFIIFIGG